MLKKIAYIGYGIVGKACHEAFKHNTEPFIIDPEYTTNCINDLVTFAPCIVFVSINAPTLDDRTVDATVIYDIFRQLVNIKYKGVVVLKSTLPPDIVHDLHVVFSRDIRYIYSPEFLREKVWEFDAINPGCIIVAGELNDCEYLTDIYRKHSHVKNFRYRRVDYKCAAMIKYTRNAFLANKVVFMNQIHALYNDIAGPGTAEWDTFADMVCLDGRIGETHMDVPGNDEQYGYGGSCFPKDVKAMIGFDKNNRLSVLKETELANTYLRLKGDVDSGNKSK